LVVVTTTQVLFAADVSNFVIQVSPNPMKPWEAADMTIKAVKSDWSTVTDYKWTIIMDFDGQQDTNAYDMPSNGFYQFTAEDQWVKTFSKWLTIKKTGQYVLKIFDSTVDSIVGTLPIVVWSTDTTSNTNTNLVEISEPLSWSVVEWSALNVIWKTDSKKTPLQFFIDDKKVVTEWETDDSGNFSVFLTDISSGAHTLQVKMVDYEWKILWTSETIRFSYTLPTTDWFLKSFTANPDGEINAWDAVVFDAQVDGTVRSVEMKIGTMGTFIMDRSATWVFNKTVIIDKAWTHKVDLTLIFEWWQRTIYADRATLNIKGTNWVSLLKVINNPADPSKVSLSWTPVWTPTSYVVRYWQSQDSLTNEIKTTSPNTEISGLEVGKQYFFQVFSVDQSGAITWKWSDIASITTQWQSSAWENATWPSCTVVGIKIRTEKIWDQYFLVRDAVPWAVEYHIYKSDYEVNNIQNMQKVWSSTVPQFAYPFDATAKKDEYSFYSVVATCSDWQNLQIDNVKKVHTWPLSDMLILFFVSLMCYFLYRIYRYN
jgi:hypothetical protein